MAENKKISLEEKHHILDAFGNWIENHHTQDTSNWQKLPSKDKRVLVKHYRGQFLEYLESYVDFEEIPKETKS